MNNYQNPILSGYGKTADDTHILLVIFFPGFYTENVIISVILLFTGENIQRIVLKKEYENKNESFLDFLKYIFIYIRIYNKSIISFLQCTLI